MVEHFMTYAPGQVSTLYITAYINYFGSDRESIWAEHGSRIGDHSDLEQPAPQIEASDSN